MKLQVTLSSIIITLFFNNIYAASKEADACNQAFQKGDVSSALIQAKKALSNNNSDKDALICQGRALTAKSDFDAALASYKLADAQSTDAFDKTISALLIGRTYSSLKQNELAIASFQQTIMNAKAAKNQAFERMGHNEIGDVYFESNQLAQALAEYMLGSKLAANDNERGESYEKAALTHHKMNQNDLALEYQIKSYLMYDKVGTLDQYAHSSIELGRYYNISKNYTSAENVLNKIIKFAKEQGGAYYEAQGSYVLAKVKVAKGDIPAAKTLVEYAKSIAKTTNDKALAQEIDQETAGLF
jgi:tetratricopeptide (TPR) repeat protein